MSDRIRTPQTPYVGEVTKAASKFMERHNLRVCNCAKCFQMILSTRHRELVEKLSEAERSLLPPFVAQKIPTMLDDDILHEKPYCPRCALGGRS